jgi:mxaA protein
MGWRMKILIKHIVVLCFSLLSFNAAASDSVRILNIIEPQQNVGVRIGDTLTRHITLEVDQPYELSKNGLPKKGEQIDGIELKEIVLASKKNGQSIIYDLDLTYQVFRHIEQPELVKLEAMQLPITGGSEPIVINIPTWQFWYSPLASGELRTAIRYVKPQMPATFVSTRQHEVGLAAFISLFILGLLLWIYTNLDGRWLPLMGGEFASAHKKLRKLGKNPTDIRPAYGYLHHAFNRIYGQNLFAKDIDDFTAEYPKFAALKEDLIHFFSQSNKALFDQQVVDATEIKDLLQLSRRLRDCERGLK